MTTASRRIPLIGVFFLLPSLALADAGITALMMVGFLHLVFGNLLIGIGEGFLISAVFRTRRLRTIFLMIAANYFSMIVGMFVPWRFMTVFMGEEPLYRLKLVILAGIALSFFLTVLLEWPFCAVAMKGQQKKAKRSLLASLLAQTASYAILVPWYYSAGGTAILGHIHIDRNLIAQTRPDATVYYISHGDVCKIRVNGTGQETVMKLGATNRSAKLFAQKGGDDAWDLWITGDPGDKDKRLLLKGFTRNPVSVWRFGNDAPLGETWDREVGDPPDFRPQNDRDWEVNVFHDEGFRARNRRTSEYFGVYLDTPFVSWWPDSAVLLPGDRVVFQFGPQIALLDLNQRKIGMLALGRGPVVVWESEPSNLP